MLVGHLDTEVSRTDTFNGNTVYSLRSAYQTRNGGNGWMRLIEFQPDANQIQVYTYSPYLNEWETDANSQFTLPYAMGGTACAPWELIQTVENVTSGSSPTVLWGNRSLTTHYEWYVTTSDGVYTVAGPIWSFTTASTTNVTVSSFTGSSSMSTAQINWTTANEMELLGFNLYRSEALDGSKQLLNANLIPEEYTGEMVGTSYQFSDIVDQGRRFYYWLQLVKTQGTELLDPVAVDTDYLVRLLLVRR